RRSTAWTAATKRRSTRRTRRRSRSCENTWARSSRQESGAKSNEGERTGPLALDHERRRQTLPAPAPAVPAIAVAVAAVVPDVAAAWGVVTNRLDVGVAGGHHRCRGLVVDDRGRLDVALRNNVVVAIGAGVDVAVAASACVGRHDEQ